MEPIVLGAGLREPALGEDDPLDAHLARLHVAFGRDRVGEGGTARLAPAAKPPEREVRQERPPLRREPDRVQPLREGVMELLEVRPPLPPVRPRSAGGR